MSTTSAVRATPALTAALALGALAVPNADAAVRKAPRLQAFTSCPALVSYARSNAARVAAGTGVVTRARPLQPQVLQRPTFLASDDRAQGAFPAMPLASPSSAERAAEATPTFSGTNVQEAGVDEPDVIKSDGRRIVAIANQELLVIDVTGPAPAIRGRLKLEGYGHQLLVRGDTALVTATVGSGGAQVDPAVSDAPTSSLVRPSRSSAPSTRLSEIALADPAAPTVRRVLTVEGAMVDARLTGATARVVITSAPGPVDPAAVGEAGLRTWVPRSVLRSRVSGRTFTRGVVPCDDVRRPARFSGLDLLSILTFDLDRGLYSVDRDAIMAGAQTVYASPDSLYVASRAYSAAVEEGTGVPAGVRTQIHRYDARGTSDTAYRATGEVPGFVLNQYALSEHEDRLRVATTTEPLWFSDSESAEESESRVTVLAEGAGRLNAVGSVGGLGKGERIYAVRFLGDRGYVVTFRQTDPLYTLDLSDPTRPAVRGELKIRGYSAYLHPVDEDRLLGVGQDATAEGRTQGAQLSLFDVSDPAAPKRVAQADLGAGSGSQAEFDPHAFLFWQPTRLGVIPLEQYPNGKEPGFVGAVGFRVDRDALSEVGRLVHPERPEYGRPPIGRSLVIAERLYTLSYDGLQAATLADLVPVGFTSFA